MKKLAANHPFLLLALATLVVGAWWHMSGIDRTHGAGQLLYRAVLALGYVFISAMRLARSVTDSRALAGLLSIALALIPYLAADWLLRRQRRRRLP